MIIKIMFTTTASPYSIATSTPVPWYDIQYSDPAVNTTVAECNTPSPSSTFTADGAAQCISKMGMNATCISSSASIAGAAKLGPFSASDQAAYSEQSGCENEALVYNAYQTDTNITNCIQNSSTTSSTTTAANVNKFSSEYCVFCGGNAGNGIVVGAACPSSCPADTSCDLSQVNTENITIENTMSTTYSDVISNMISQSIQQIASIAQNETTGTGNVEQGGKSANVSSISKDASTTNDNINTVVTNILNDFTDTNSITFQCGSPAFFNSVTGVQTPAWSNCIGCLPVSQMNSSSILVNNIINSGFTTGIANTSLASILQSTSVSQTTDNKASTGASFYTSHFWLYICLTILGVVLILGLVKVIPQFMKKGNSSRSTSSSSKSTPPSSKSIPPASSKSIPISTTSTPIPS